MSKVKVIQKITHVETTIMQLPVIVFSFPSELCNFNNYGITRGLELRKDVTSVQKLSMFLHKSSQIYCHYEK